MPPPKILSAYDRERKILDTVIEQNEPLVLVLDNAGKAHHARQRLYSFLRLYRQSGGTLYDNVGFTLAKGSCDLLIDPEGSAINLRKPTSGSDVEVSSMEDFFKIKAPRGVKI